MANVKSKKPAKKKGGRATSAQKSVRKANVKKAASQQKMMAKAYRREKKALAGAMSGSGANAAMRQKKVLTEGSLESKVRSGSATRGESAAFRASHEAARVKSGIYGTAKRTASAVTKPTVTNTSRAVRHEIGTANASASRELLKKKKPL